MSVKRPRPLSSIVPQVVNPVLGKKGLVLGKLLEHWPAIAGPETARRASPEKITFRKDKKGNATATLYLAATSADAALLEYEKTVLLEKIRMMTGEGRIKEIRFVHNTATPPKAKKAKTPPARALTPEEVQKLNSLVENVGDEKIREALKSMGESLLTQQPGGHCKP